MGIIASSHHITTIILFTTIITFTPSDCDVTRYVILIVVIIAVVITFAGFMSGLENIDKTKANLLHEIDTADNTGVKNEAIKAKNALVNGGWVTDTSEVAKTCQL